MVAYGGGTFDEMDLDGLLARKPQLALVDELAHTNAPGSRHPKRYLDVEELLQAGIDVHTTLNIQHVESLNDVVAQITRIRVRETVPDSILDRADDIEVIDLSPGDLIQRLREGKVYLPRQAERALKHYFSPGNLTALRELALRRTAQQVDDQLVTHMRAHAIPGPWAAGERVLVCVSEDPRSSGLVRYAKRLADRLRAPFTALTVESRRSASLSEAERDRIADTLRLAERLGGETATLPSQGRIADDVVAFAREHNVTHVVIGKSTRSRWFELLNGSVVHDLLRRSGPISVHVVAGQDLAGEAAAGAPAAHKGVRTAPPPRPGPLPYVAALATVGGALCIGLVLQSSLGHESTDLVFLTAVVAVRCGSACIRRSPRSWPRRSPTTSSSCRRSTPSRSPIPPTSSRCSSSPWWRWWSRTSQAGCGPRRRSRARARGRRRRSTASRASSRAAAPSTTCSGPPPTRSP